MFSLILVPKLVYNSTGESTLDNKVNSDVRMNTDDPMS